MNKGKLFLVIGGAVVLLGLFIAPQLNDPNRVLKKAWAEVDVGCLPSQGQVAQHMHPVLAVTLDGQRVPIPANIGILRGCIAEIHTHDNSGTLHIEPLITSKNFTLKDFFKVWGESFEKEGYTMEVTVDGQPSPELGNLILRDGQQIILNYINAQGI